MTPAAAVKKLRKLEDDLRKAIQKADEKTAWQGVLIARKLSSGTVSLRTIRLKYDHAFAVRHGTPLLNPTIVNKQKGEFWASWRMGRKPDGTYYIVADEIIAPHARFLETGTKTMFARSIKDEIEFELERIRRKNIQDAIDKWVQKANR